MSDLPEADQGAASEAALSPSYDAVVLAGGEARRFGADKLAVPVDGVPLLDRALAAVAGARRRVVVGPPRTTADDAVTWTREDPPGAGPAAAVVAGLRVCTASYVVLLAGDLPYVGAPAVTRLLAALAAGPAVDGAHLVDADGRAQHLCSAWRRDSLVRAVAARDDWTDAPVRRLLAPLDVRAVSTEGREARDIDRPEDLPSEA